ncbi:MAG: phosphopantothenate/pantothenate synthetase [Euryarchaeota archaeon]|nr:phosphopantothenate/pantothenate synthetase [Euryarchaeota archaeon]
MVVPKSHPRYESLMKRERIIEGFKKGLVAYAGLIAHGRGETFDYLIGERTCEFARIAECEAVKRIKAAKNPVFSVNGNVAALAVDEVIALARILNMKIEVNLFYRTEERVRKIAEEFRARGVEVLGEAPDAKIPGLDHARALCTREGIYSADVVLVPLEDGDRTQALRNMGKFVITIDLNPMSRTAKTADITIVDELTRALANMVKYAENPDSCNTTNYDNNEILAMALKHIKERLERLAQSPSSSGLNTNPQL